MSDTWKQKASRTFVSVFLSAFLLSGFYQLYLGLSEAVSAWRLVQMGTQTQGTVIDFYYKTSSGSVGSTRAQSCVLSYPIVRFRAPEGERQFKNGLGSCGSHYAKGEVVTVLYVPDANMGSPRIYSFGTLWLGSILAGVMGMLTVTFSGFLLLFLRKPGIMKRVIPPRARRKKKQA